jgi:hypothetical protein
MKFGYRQGGIQKWRSAWTQLSFATVFMMISGRTEAALKCYSGGSDDFFLMTLA